MEHEMDMTKGATEAWRARLDNVHQLILRERGGVALPAPEEIIRAMRDERDADLCPDMAQGEQTKEHP
jgi:hypothetical protein